MANTTWNPSDKSAGVTLSNSNLTATATSGVVGARAVDKQITGKFYFEITIGATFTSSSCVGLSMGGAPFASTGQGTAIVVQAGAIFVNGTNISVSIGALSAGNVVCIAIDVDADLLWFRVGAAGNWNGNAGNAPNTGVGGVNTRPFGGGPAYPLYPYVYLNINPSSVTANFGDSAFTGTVPSGFTSGFTSGATPPVNAVATQLAAEHWLTTNPQQQVTQIALEHWATVTGTGLQAIITQIALEQWATVAIRAGGPMITMIG